MMTTLDWIALSWVALSGLYALTLFGFDKSRAGKPGKKRTPEFHLLLISALGGWLGGLAGMLLFGHKTAKLSFQLKFALAFIVWAGLIWAYWQSRRYFPR